MPLGDCFEVAFLAAWKLADSGVDVSLVHSRPLGQGKISGRRHAHGWIEVGDAIIDHSNDKEVVVRRELYYAIARFQEEPLRYSFDEARRLAVETEHYGPWALQEDDS